jgi:hypothetical protein
VISQPATNWQKGIEGSVLVAAFSATTPTCACKISLIPIMSKLPLLRQSMPFLRSIFAAAALISMVSPVHANTLSLTCEMVKEGSTYAKPQKILINLDLASGAGSYDVPETAKTKRLVAMVQGNLITMREESLLGIDRTDGSTLVLNTMDKKIIRTVLILGVPFKKKEIGECFERRMSAT